MQGRATPAPIFNQRKRQRQAMFTDANQPGPPNKMPDLMPVGGFTGGQRQPTFNRSVCGGLNKTAIPNPISSCKPNFGNRQPNVGFNSSKPNNIEFNHSALPTNSFNHSASSTNNYNQSKTSENFPKNNFNQSNNQGKSINQSNYRSGFNQSSNRHNYNQPTNSYGTQRKDSSSVDFGPNGPYSKQRQYGGAPPNQGNQRQQFQPNCSYDQPTTNFDGSMPGNSGVHTVNSYDSRFQSTSMFGNTGSRGSDYGQSVSNSSNWNLAFGNKNPPQQTMFSNNNRNNRYQPNFITNSQQFRSNEKQIVQQPTTKSKIVQKPPEIDKSLKIITTDIDGCKKWGQRKGANMNLLFEVFGMVDSAVLMNQSGTGKEFILKDGMDTIQCLFYEIDRSLPRLTRGQWHRCVGTYEGKTGKMKCVAVRPAGPEERKLAKLTMYLSNKSLEGFSRAISEQ
ncbi:hypothetical protein LOTGIDRAFT_228416 [Lottia gigantea]|uniref:Spermatogenesis-associated protein 22 n=1 Tax=Lottia gigantea TaxID=225164 RepID=V4ALA4_LOTGI|nr:hypothetical protein LOTGIDRAFT_228416 [Lottia gigantea]ESO97882.1 hypothetical protein LOTGIDRAFT_228416 [Lottia gigantea]